jgi:hypothetical protein
LSNAKTDHVWAGGSDRYRVSPTSSALGGFRVGGKLSLDTTIGADFVLLKSVAPPGGTPKLTIPSPSMLYYRGGRAAIDAVGLKVFG